MKEKILLLSLVLGGAIASSSAATSGTVAYAPALQLISADPAAGTALEFPGAVLGRDYTFNTNINSQVGYMEADWYDVTGNPEEPEWIGGTYAYHTKGDNSPLVITSYNAYDSMLVGHEYEMRVYLYDQEVRPRTDLGEFTVMYKGASVSYEYSDIKAIAVSPNPETYVIEDVSEGHFTVSFSGAVEINKTASNISHGVMGVVPYASITPNADKTEWTFVIPEAELEDRVINCFIQAKDAEGRTVIGNEDMEEYMNGEGEGAGFMFTYTSQLAGYAIVVTPSGGKVDELKTFTVTAEGTFNVMNPSWTAYPYLMKDKEFIYQFNLETDATKGGSKMTLTIPDDKVPTASGRYQLIFPYACFMFQITADEQGGYANKYTVISYTLGEAPKPSVTYDLAPASITPAAGNVNQIEKIDINFAQDVNLMLYDAYILNEADETVAKADIEFDDDINNLTDYHIVFNPAITEKGTYTLYIPEATFGDDAYADTGAGHANAAIRETYVISSTSGVGGLESESYTGNVYDVTGVCVMENAKASQLNTLSKGLYIFNGKKIVIR